MIRAALLAAVLPMAALAQSDQAEDMDHHLAEAEGLRVLHAWTNAGAQDTMQVFMEIENAGDTLATLQGARMEGGGEATIVASPIRAGGGVPETLDGLILAPGVETVLEPGGLYLLVSGVESPRAQGEHLHLVLTFEPIGEIEVAVDVEAADATQHSHAGHAH